jgi:hypothetical protein
MFRMMNSSGDCTEHEQFNLKVFYISRMSILSLDT